METRVDTRFRAMWRTVEQSALPRLAFIAALAAVILWSLTPAVLAAGFSDVPADHPYAAAISDLTDRRVVSGFADGGFHPDAAVSRQQFAKMIIRALGIPVSATDSHPFTDLPENSDPADPFYPNNYVAICYQRGLMTSPSPTSFAPFAELSRAELITAVARVADLPDPPATYDPPFADSSPDDYDWARRAAYAGLLEGITVKRVTSFLLGTATRGECAQVLYNLLTLKRSSSTEATDEATVPAGGDAPGGAATIATSSGSDVTAAEPPPVTVATMAVDPTEAGRGIWGLYTPAGIAVVVVVALIIVTLRIRRARRARIGGPLAPSSGGARLGGDDAAAILRAWGAERNRSSAPMGTETDPDRASAWQELLDAVGRARAADDPDRGEPNKASPRF